jgi:hypothetical protein
MPHMLLIVAGRCNWHWQLTDGSRSRLLMGEARGGQTTYFSIRRCKECSGSLEMLAHIPRGANSPCYDVFRCTACDTVEWICTTTANRACIGLGFGEASALAVRVAAARSEGNRVPDVEPHHRWLTDLGVLTARPWASLVFLAYVAATQLHQIPSTLRPSPHPVQGQ